MSPVLELFQHHLRGGASISLDACPRIVYDVAANTATFSTGPVQLTGGTDSDPSAARHLLRWEIADGAARHSQLSANLSLEGNGSYLIRCDRVELPPGGTAYLHTHRGPGIRCLVEGRFRVESAGLHQTIEQFGAWFENGADPVEAHAVSDTTAAFVRVMLLPRDLLGRSSLQYVRESDKERPKPQRYQVFVDEPLDL